MNENLDLTKILEGCPVGTKLYSPCIGSVECKSIFDNYIYVETRYGNFELFDSKGIYGHYYGECMLFPSEDQRDWSKFERFWDKPKKVDRFDPKVFQPFDKVLIKNGNFWTPNFFSYIAGQWVNCVGTGDVECVPYNEETKHLIGTNDDCPEYYKWWEE